MTGMVYRFTSLSRIKWIEDPKILLDGASLAVNWEKISLEKTGWYRIAI